mmetsp:Transcript_8353/g.17021  ORF Transcript_8353/g.17021 Transcript_8353/m.17021 type:complete len:105 (-) Transcript_8353:1162-1476(-)
MLAEEHIVLEKIDWHWGVYFTLVTDEDLLDRSTACSALFFISVSQMEFRHDRVLKSIKHCVKKLVPLFSCIQTKDFLHDQYFLYLKADHLPSKKFLQIKRLDLH